MTYRNPANLRKPVAMLRANAQEQADLDFLVDHYGGGEPAAVFREALIELAKAKRHVANPLASARLDTRQFPGLRSA